MKRFKQLLCFILTWATCIVGYILTFFKAPNFMGNTIFVSMKNYIKMYLMHDGSTVLRSLYNTYFHPLAVVILIAVIALILKQTVLKEKLNKLYYPLILFISTASYYIVQMIKLWVFYKKLTDGYFWFNYTHISTLFLALQFGIFACFIFWLGCLIIEKSKRHKQIIKIAEENFNKTLENFAKQNPDEVAENFDMNNFSLHYHRAKRNKNVVSYIFTVKYKNQKKYSYILKTHNNYEVLDDVFYKINLNT